MKALLVAVILCMQLAELTHAAATAKEVAQALQTKYVGKKEEMAKKAKECEGMHNKIIDLTIDIDRKVRCLLMTA